MLPIEVRLEFLRGWTANVENDVLSIYADINPAKPENAGRAWRTRIKNALKAIPETRERHGKHYEALYEQVLQLLELERPHARTLAIFAHQSKHGQLFTERLDLQIDIPVVDTSGGRVEARYGEPYLAPLWFAVDEYERCGIVLLEGIRWRFFEVFLDEIREDLDVLADIAEDEWKTLQALGERISATLAQRAGRPHDRFDRLSPQDRNAARMNAWQHRLYTRLAHLLDKAVDQLSIERLVLVGERWKVSHFEAQLNRSLRERIVARLPMGPEMRDPTAAKVWEWVQPVLRDAERNEELALLRKVREDSGVWGVDAVLDALQLGRVSRWILPWDLDLSVWQTPDGHIAATREQAESLGGSAECVSLRDLVLKLAAEHGAALEFVRGPAEEQLVREMGGMAALLRW